MVIPADIQAVIDRARELGVKSVRLFIHQPRINDGPIAAIYEAVDTIHGVRVALKIPHESAMDEHFLVDFKREARLAQRLEHPNILPIRDASFIDGRFVIAGSQALYKRGDGAGGGHRVHQGWMGCQPIP